MKKKFIIILLLLCKIYSANSQIFASSQYDTLQIQDSSTMTAQRFRDTCFALLNLSASQIPSGYLLDYSLNAFNDSIFNSLISSKIDTISDAGVFFGMHNILTSCVVNSNATQIGLTDSFFINARRYQRNTGNIPLLFLYQQYQKIRKTALSQGLFTLTPDSLRLKDVTGRSNSPYDNEIFFAFSPVQNSIDRSNSIPFTLPSQFWLMPGITSVQIDFGDGAGFRTLSPNNSVNINYVASGIYYLTAKITVNGGTLIAKSSIQYTIPKYYYKPDSVWNITAAPLYTTISNYLSSHGAAPLGVKPSGLTPCSDGSIFDAVNCDIGPGQRFLYKMAVTEYLINL